MAATTDLPPLPPPLESEANAKNHTLDFTVSANASAVLNNLRRDAGDDNDTISYGRGGTFSDDDDDDDEYIPAERHFIGQCQSVKVLLAMCRGMKDEDGEELIDLEKAPWNTIKKKDKPGRADYHSEIKRRWKVANPNDNRVGPRPDGWNIPKCDTWFNENPINDSREVVYLKAKIEEIKLELIAAEAAHVDAETGDGPNGKLWSGILPPMRLFHAILDVEANKAAFIARNALSNSREEVDNRNSDVRRPNPWKEFQTR